MKKLCFYPLVPQIKPEATLCIVPAINLHARYTKEYLLYRFTTILKLICHLREEHHISTHELEFNTMREFQSWKAKEELETNSELERECKEEGSQKFIAALILSTSRQQH
jgi:hypothetical protein